MIIQPELRLESLSGLNAERCPFDERAVAQIKGKFWMIDTITKNAQRITKGAYDACVKGWQEYATNIRMVYGR